MKNSLSRVASKCQTLFFKFYAIQIKLIVGCIQQTAPSQMPGAVSAYQKTRNRLLSDYPAEDSCRVESVDRSSAVDVGYRGVCACGNSDCVLQYLGGVKCIQDTVVVHLAGKRDEIA